jgi:hypothetical protein
MQAQERTTKVKLGEGAGKKAVTPVARGEDAGAGGEPFLLERFFSCLSLANSQQQ